MDGVASSGMRHWKCPCNLLRQPAALQQRHQYFRLMGRLEIYELLLSLTHNGIYTIIFFLLLQKKTTWDILDIDTGRQKQKKKKKRKHVITGKKKNPNTHFSFTKNPNIVTARQSAKYSNFTSVYECLCVYEKKGEKVSVCVCVCEHN